MSKVAGITDIQTDVETQICSFRILKAGPDLKAKLIELSKTNSHMEQLEVLEGIPADS